MVTFTTDPRIAYARARQQAGMKQAMTPYQLPRNPYGGSPIAGNLQRLADALGARWAGAEAVRLQEGQKRARSQVLASILEAGGATPPPGGNYFEQFATDVPLAGVSPPPGARETQLRRKEIGDDGRAAFSPVSAEIAETAGIDPLQLKLLYDKARLEGNVATEKAIKREAQRGMERAIADKNWPLVEQWGNILDPTAGLERELKRQTLLEERIYEKTQKLEEIRQRQIEAEAAGDRDLVTALAKEARHLEATLAAETRAEERAEREPPLPSAMKNFEVNEAFTYNGVDYKPGDMFGVNVQDSDFLPHINKGVFTTRQRTLTGPDARSPFDVFRAGDGGEDRLDGAERSDEEKELLSNANELLERGSRTFLNQAQHVLNKAVAYLFGAGDVWPEERERVAELNLLRNTLMAPLVKAIAERGGRFAIEIIDPILPSSKVTANENLQRIRKLIPRYEQELLILNDAYYRAKEGSVQQVNIGRIQASILGLMPILRNIVSASEAAVKGTIWKNDEEVGGERFICEQEFCKKENGAPGWRRLTNG